MTTGGMTTAGTVSDGSAAAAKWAASSAWRVPVRWSASAWMVWCSKNSVALASGSSVRSSFANWITTIESIP